MTSPGLTTVAIQRYVTSFTPQNIATRRMVITPDATGIQPLTLPWSPLEVDHTDLIANLTVQNRVGLDDTLIFNNHKLRKQAFTVITDDVQIGLKRTTWPAEQVVEHFRQFGFHGYKCKITYDTYSSGDWYMTNLSFKVTKRDPNTNEMSAASITVEFTQDPASNGSAVGPVTGGAKTSQATNNAVMMTATVSNTQTPAVRSYTVVAGDTLWSISYKFYGDGDKWRQIADANGIQNPRTLKIGQVLKIP